MHFRLLGPLEVWDRGRGVALRRPKQRALLAILLLRPRESVSTDVLIEELWGESPPRTARAALQNYVAQLRRALGPGVLESSSGGYLLDVGPEQIDLGRFERLVSESREVEGEERVAKLQEALALWQGAPLAELAFEPFAAREISRLEELRTSALEDLIDAQLALGAGTELLDRLEALVAAQPFRERLRGQQMLALYRDGRQAEALEVYQDTRKTLVDELGIEPGAALRELEQAILRQDPSLDGPERPAKQEPPPLEERRKVVTILFADVACFDTVDPELMQRTSVEALARMRGVLETHGATIEQRAGDEVMAVFGIPLAHEDDALRAARAGLELQAEVGRLSDLLEHSGRGRLELRVGIATGEVLTGVDDTAHGFVAGPAITLAKRTLQAAGADEVLAGAETLQLLDETVVSDPAGDSGRLLELLEVASARRPEAPLVGRAAELGALRDAYGRAVEERTCRICLVLGEPGIGKTRLTAELTSALEREAAILLGHCVSYGKGATYLPLAEIVGEVERGQPLIELLADQEHAELIVARLADLAGEAQPAASGGETFWAVRRVLETLASERPVVVVFEDLHWAEPTLLDLIDYLASHVADAPVLVLGLARPELLETRADWAEVDAVTLSPLSSEDADALVGNLGELPVPLREKVVRTAGGNPLFIEQLLAHASETGETESMPPSLEALLASRLDRLEPIELSVLQRAAVVGREFRRGAVVQLVPRDEAAAVGKHLVELGRKGLLEGDEAFRFRHVLIRDAAYATLPKAQRAELHERFGRWLESQRTGSDELIGFHLEQAHDYRVGLDPDDAGAPRLAADAGDRLSAAGLRAAKRGDMPAASNLLTRASSLMEARDIARHDLLTELGLVLWRRGEVGDAQELFEKAIETAVSARDRRAELRGRAELGFLRLHRAEEGASEELLTLASKAIPVLEKIGDDRALGRFWYALATTTGSFFCQYQKSSEAAEHALGYFRRSGWPLLPCLQAIAASLYYGPTPVPEAIRRCRVLLQEADRGGTAQILLFLAGLEAMAGRFDSARACAAQTRQIYEDLAWTVNVVTMHEPMAAEIELLAGNHAEAERLLADSCRKLEDLGLGQLGTHGSRLAEAIYAQGRHAEAIRLSETAEACAAHYDTGAQFLWRAIRGKALAREGALDEGERLTREAAELAATTDSVCQHAQMLLAYAEVLLLQSSREKAVEAVDEAVELLEAKGNVAAGRQARALLA